MKLKIGIIDYGIGNSSSLINTLVNLGFKAKLTLKHNEIRESDIILLPGVGAFEAAMYEIKNNGLDNLIFELAKKNKPIIGICLGMQLLGRSSIEKKFTKGLNLIPEDVLPFNSGKIHIGWNSIEIAKNPNPLKIYNTEYYFNHSYSFSSKSKYKVSETSFNGEKFTSIIKKNNIMGLQFHPEKSQISGLKLLKNIILDLSKNA